MKKFILILSFLIWQNTEAINSITGVGNINPNYPTSTLVGYAGCGTTPGDTFSVSGFDFSDLDRFNLSENGFSPYYSIENIVTINPNLFTFELPNASVLGLGEKKLSGFLYKDNNSNSSTDFFINVIACPTVFIGSGTTVGLEEPFQIIGNDLDLVESIYLVDEFNITITALNFNYNLQDGSLLLAVPNIPSLVGSDLTLLINSTVAGLNGSIFDQIVDGGFTITTPSIPFLPIPPHITTVLGLNGAKGTNVEILGTGFESNAVVNFGGIFFSGLTSIPGGLSLSMPTGSFSAPYITVTNPSPPGLSSTWYFTPQITYPNGSTILGSNFDVFTMAGSGYGLALPINKSNFPPNLLLHGFNGNLYNVENGSGASVLLLNNPIGVFATTIPASNMKTIDINGDGGMELVYADNNSLLGWDFTNFSSTPILILQTGLDQTINDFDFGDFNADGKLDFYINTEAPLIYTSPTNSIGLLSLSNALNIKVSDINGDGKADISFVNGNNNSGYIINSSFNGTLSGADFQSSFQINYTPPGVNVDTKYTDLNNDGNIDFVSLHKNDNGNSGNLEFNFQFGKLDGQQQYVFSGTGINLPNDLDYQSLASADLNGDGFMDFVVNGINANGKSVFAYLTNTNGTGFNVTYQTFVGEAFTKVVVADFNGDGGMDLAALNSVSGLSFFKNNLPCNSLSTPIISSQLPNVTIGGNNLFTLKYSGPKPNAISWMVSVPGASGFSAILNRLGSASVSFTNTFEKTFDSNVAASYNYFNSVSINTIPLSLSGAVLMAEFSNFCGEIITVTSPILVQQPCQTIDGSNFSISGLDFPYTESNNATFQILSPTTFLGGLQFNWFISNSGINTEITRGTTGNNKEFLNIPNIPLSLNGANLYALASYCGSSFTVSSYVITVIPNVPFCETVSSSNFSISGLANAFSEGDSYTFDVDPQQPTQPLPDLKFAWFSSKAGIINQISDYIPLFQPNILRLEIFNMPLSLNGANLFAVASYCGPSFTVLGANVISVTSIPTICQTVSSSNFSILGLANAINVGSNALFNVLTVNPILNNDINFEWFSSASSNSLAFGRVLTITNIPLSLNGTNLYAVASYCGGNFTVSGANSIILNTCPSPLNLTQPIVTTSSPVCVGGSVSLSYSVQNVDIIQWQKSIDSGISWLDLTENGTYLGVNTSSLAIQNITTVFGNALFRATFVNTFCGTTLFGNALSINISPSAKITRQPESPSPTCPETPIFIETAFQGNITAFQWQIKSLGNATFTDILAVSNNGFFNYNSESLDIRTPKASLDGSQFRVLLTESCGSQLKTITSNVVSVSVVTATSPIITNQPNVVKVCNLSDIVSLKFTATGVDMTYRWLEKEGSNGVILPLDFNNSAYSINPNIPEILNINNPDKNIFANRQYFVEITGNCGVSSLSGTVTSSGIALSFYEKPELIPNISNNCVLGSSSISVKPDPAFESYQWLIDGAINIGENTTTSSYNLFMNGNYSVMVNGRRNCFANSYNYRAPSVMKATITTDNTDRDSALTTNDAKNYQWFVDDRFISGATNKRLINYFNGVFKVVNTYDNDCTSQSESFVVSVPGWRKIARSEVNLDVSMLAQKSKSDEITNIQITPNPSQGKFEVVVSASAQNSRTANLYDLHGKLIFSKSMEYYYGTHSATFEIDGIAKGIYQVQITGGTELKWAKVVIY